MTLAVVVSQSYGDTPRLRVDVNSTPSGPLPVPNGSTVAVYRVHEDGSRFRVITEVNARLVGGSWAGFDYHAPFNQAVTYVAVAAGQESAASGPQYLLSDATWLIHSADPTLSVMVDAVTKVDPFTRKATAARHEVFGKPTRFVSGERRKGRTGSIEIVCDTVENEQAVYDLLEDDTPVLINTPAARDLTWLWVQFGDDTPVLINTAEPRDLTWSWVQFRDESHANPGSKVTVLYRLVSVGFEETDQPDVDLSPPWTYGDIDATYASYTAIDAEYASYEDLALDVR